MFEYCMFKAADGCSVGVNTWSRLQKSELAGRIMAGPWVILTMKKAFSKNFFFNENSSPPCILFKVWLIWWIVLIKSEILIATGMVWPVSSDKWKAPLGYEIEDEADSSVLESFNELCITAECKWNLFRLRLIKTSLKLDDWSSTGRTG